MRWKGVIGRERGCGVGGVDRDSHVEGCLCCREQVDSGPATVSEVRWAACSLWSDESRWRV